MACSAPCWSEPVCSLITLDLGVKDADGAAAGFEGEVTVRYGYDEPEETFTLDCHAEASCGTGCSCAPGLLQIDRGKDLDEVELHIVTADGPRYDGVVPVAYDGGPGSCCPFTGEGTVVVEP